MTSGMVVSRRQILAGDNRGNSSVGTTLTGDNRATQASDNQSTIQYSRHTGGLSPLVFWHMHYTSKHTILFKMFQTNGGVPRTRAIPSVMTSNSNSMCLSLLTSMDTPPLPPGPLCHVFNCASKIPFTESQEYLKFFCKIFCLTQMSSIHAVYSIIITARSDILSSNRPFSSDNHM
jgi:hypothetical protein